MNVDTNKKNNTNTPGASFKVLRVTSISAISVNLLSNNFAPHDSEVVVQVAQRNDQRKKYKHKWTP